MAKKAGVANRSNVLFSDH